MKKVFVLVVVGLCYALTSTAQSFYWIGSPGGNWNNGANWSLSQGGTAAGDFPKDASDDAIIPASATISFNTSVDINSLSVTGTSSIVAITGVGGTDRFLTLKSTNAGAPAIKINAGCRLENTATINTWFRLIMGENAIGDINGEWYFSGDIEDNAIASFYLGDAGFNTRLNINSGGSIIISEEGFIEPNEETGDDYLVFKTGSKLKLLGNGPVVPAADYAAGSTIEITGVTDASVIFEEAGSVGNITYNCAGQSNGSYPLYLSLLTFSVDGNLNILNTNNNELALISFNSTNGMTTREATIKGNLNIQGNSRVAVAHNDGMEFANNLYVEGNLVMNGSSLTLHSGNFISSSATTLYVKGNITHSAGTLSSSSTIVNEQQHLFIIEMNGNTAQTISSHSGTFDNAQKQVTLRMNNPAGVSLLSNLSVGRISFNSTGKGILNTGSHTLTVNNSTPASVSTIVVESPSAAGYINGTMVRNSASQDPVLLPVGDAANYRPVTLLPSSTGSTAYQAKFVNSDHGGTYLAPVRKVANYYWEVERISGSSDAAIQLNIPGVVPGSLAGYDLAVGRYDGTNWVSTKGTTGIVVSPGNSASGTVRSSVQSAFGAFTISLESEGALPTYLLSFDLKKAEKTAVDLEWVITDNSTPARFDVLRSADGKDFSPIGTVTGNSDIRKYAYRDVSMLNGNNFYKLRMIDRDGSVTYSVVKVAVSEISGISFQSLMPTLVRDITKARITSTKAAAVQIAISDVNGRILHMRTVNVNSGSTDITLSAANLVSGMYHVTVSVAGEKPATLRFIKQ